MCLGALAGSLGDEFLSSSSSHPDPWGWEDPCGRHVIGQVKGKGGAGGWKKMPPNDAQEQ